MYYKNQFSQPQTLLNSTYKHTQSISSDLQSLPMMPHPPNLLPAEENVLDDFDDDEDDEGEEDDYGEELFNQ